MSVHHVEWAIEQTQITGAAYTVLLILANMSNADDLCWPSEDTLAQKAHLTDRGLRKALVDLEQAGVLARTRRTHDNGQCRSSVYALFGCTKGANEGERGSVTRGNVVPREGERGSVKNQLLETTTNNQLPEPPPPARANAAENEGGGGGLPGDAEVEALLAELQTITNRPPANYERSVLSVLEYGHYRRRALLELRRDWVTVKSKNNTGWWLKRVIERLIDEHQRANAPLFPIDDAAALEERRRKYVIRDEDETIDPVPWVPPWETQTQPAVEHERGGFWM